MTVSPRGNQPRAGQAAPSTGETAESTVLPPTLLRLPNLDPAHQQTLQLARQPQPQSEKSGSAAGYRSSTPNAASATEQTIDPAPGRRPFSTEPTTEGRSQAAPPPAPTAWKPPPQLTAQADSEPPTPPRVGSQPQEISRASEPAASNWPTAAGAPNATPSPQAPALEKQAQSSSQRSDSPARTTASQPNERTGRSDTQQGPVPEGRSWMEKMGSQTTVLLVLLAITATAVIAGRRRDSDAEESLQHPSNQEMTGDPLTLPEAEIAEQPADSPLAGSPAAGRGNNGHSMPPERAIDAVSDDSRMISQPQNAMSQSDFSRTTPEATANASQPGSDATLGVPELTRPDGSVGFPASSNAMPNPPTNTATVDGPTEAEAKTANYSQQAVPTTSSSLAAEEPAATRQTRTPNGIVDWSYYIPSSAEAGFAGQPGMDEASKLSTESPSDSHSFGSEFDGNSFSLPPSSPAGSTPRMSSSPKPSAQR